MHPSSFVSVLKTLLRDIWRAYWILLKIMVPALLLVKVLESVGGTAWLAWCLGPLMSGIGLPGELGLVWATAILTNLYTAMVVFYELSGGASYSAAEVSILGCMILVSHALPVEGAVAKVVGVPWRLTLATRIGGAYLFAWLVSLGYQMSDRGDYPAAMLWQPAASPSGWQQWALSQLQMLVLVFLVLGSLIVLMRTLRYLGVERLLVGMMSPLTYVLSVRPQAANVTIIGLLLGLSFGAGLLIDASRSGEITRRDMCIVICFLGLCHSLIEDTLLILLLGAELLPILGGRILFSLVVMLAIIRMFYRKPIRTLS